MDGEYRKGMIYALGSYLIWGMMPLYVVLMISVNPFELVGWRVFASLVVASLFLTIMRGWKRLRALWRDKRALAWLAASGIAILVNWTTFAYAVLSERVLDTSLGYFLNPLLSVVLAVVFLREKMRPLQWTAVGIMAVAVVVMIVGYGSVPLIALMLAASFGTYGLLKKQAGKRVDALVGFTVETAATIPFSIGMIVIVALTGGLTITEGPSYVPLLVLGFGLVTAFPLVMFASAARRLPLTVLSIMQYIAPIMSFLFGVFLLHEPMPIERLAAFALVWLALVVFTIDTMIYAGRSRRAARAARVEPLV